MEQSAMSLSENDLFEKIGRLVMYNEAMAKRLTELEQNELKAQSEKVTRSKPSEK